MKSAFTVSVILLSLLGACAKPPPSVDHSFVVESTNAFRWHDGSVYATPDHYARKVADFRIRNPGKTVSFSIRCARHAWPLVRRGFEQTTGLKVQTPRASGCRTYDVAKADTVFWQETYRDITDYVPTPTDMARFGGVWQGQGEGYTFTSEIKADGTLAVRFLRGGAVFQIEYGHVKIEGNRQYVVITERIEGDPDGERKPYLLKPYNVYDVTEDADGVQSFRDLVSGKVTTARRISD